MNVLRFLQVMFPRREAAPGPEPMAAGPARDAALLALLRRGDGRALEILVRHHQDRAYRVALGITGNEADAEAVCRAVFLSVLRALPGFQGAAALEDWIGRVATNAARAQVKRRGDAGTTPGEPLPDRSEPSPGPYQVAESAQASPAADTGHMPPAVGARLLAALREATLGGRPVVAR